MHSSIPNTFYTTHALSKSMAAKKNPIIEKKMVLKDSWDVLKDEQESERKKTQAARAIVQIQKELQKLDPKFSPIDLSTTQYGPYLLDAPDDGKKSGGWPTLDEDGKKYMSHLGYMYGQYVALAVEIVRARSPDMEISSPNLFGQVVNATTTNLIQLAKVGEIQGIYHVLRESMDAEYEEDED